MRKAEEYVAELGYPMTPSERLQAVQKIEQAQREAVEEAARVAQFYRGRTPVFIETKIRTLVPHREGQ